MYLGGAASNGDGKAVQNLSPDPRALGVVGGWSGDCRWSGQVGRQFAGQHLGAGGQYLGQRRIERRLLAVTNRRLDALAHQGL